MRSGKFIAVIAVLMMFIASGCNMDYRSKDEGGESSTPDTEYTKLSTIQYIESSDIDVKSHMISDKDGENVITLSREGKEYLYYKFTKTGNYTSDDADTSGKNAAILANNSARLTLRASIVVASGDHAHGVFSQGEGTNVTVSECVVVTRGDNSSGAITSGGGAMNLYHATIETFGQNSPAVHVPSGSEPVTVSRGRYSTFGTSSPALYSEGEIEVSNAKLESLSSPAVIVSGKSVVTLKSCDISTVSDESSVFMIHQVGSGKSTLNTPELTLSRGKISAVSGEIFYVTNTKVNITLNDVNLIDMDSGDTLMRAEASSWGTSGMNGGKVTLQATDQQINGDIYLDGLSDMNMYLNEGSFFTGTVNKSGTNARVYVEINNSKWVLAGDSHIDSLTCSESSIALNGYNLYVNGEEYKAGTESSGTEIDFDTDRNAQTDTDNTDEDNTDEGNTDEDNTDEDNTGDDTSSEDTNISDQEDTNTPEVQVYTLTFDLIHKSTGTVNGVSYRVYSDIVYVSKPTSNDTQRMNVYIPEPYFSSRPVNGYTAQTAPIFIPNNSSGYMAASVVTPSSTNPVGLALSRGMIVVSPVLRGRNVTGGTAPAAIVDYKAAVKYLRANKSRLPAGDTDKIIACGVSSGGALAAILGASGNSLEYSEQLDEIGAAEDVSDEIFAVACYCPVTNLENADSAYEWVFGGEKYGEDSKTLAENFTYYLNDMALVNDSVDMMIYDYDVDDEDYEEGQTFRRYIESLYANAAQKALDAGTSITESWITVSNDKVLSADLYGYADSFPVRQKGIPAFDKFDLSSPENSEFGYKHFTDYSYSNSTIDGEMADTSVISAMNPMEHIDNNDVCQHWRIRHGVNDRDITLTIPAILALKLENSGFTVDFSAVWGQGHGGYYDTEELFDWIDSICK